MEIVNNNYQTVFESLGNCLFFHIDYTMPGRKRQRPIRVVVVFDLLVGHSVWKMSARFTFRTKQGKGSKNGHQQMITINIDTK